MPYTRLYRAIRPTTDMYWPIKAKHFRFKESIKPGHVMELNYTLRKGNDKLAVRALIHARVEIEEDYEDEEYGVHFFLRLNDGKTFHEEVGLV